MYIKLYIAIKIIIKLIISTALIIMYQRAWNGKSLYLSKQSRWERFRNFSAWNHLNTEWLHTESYVIWSNEIQSNEIFEIKLLLHYLTKYSYESFCDIQ